MPTSAHPPVRQNVIISHLRGRIVSGELRPGDRLPTRVQIKGFFSASPTTIQRAMDRLVEDGFVTPAGRRGTLVSEYPPHLCNYALVFPHRVKDPGWVRFWTVLASAAESRMPRESARLSIYRGIEAGPEDADHKRLADDVQAHRMAGIVFAADPWPLKGSPILELPGLPRVAFRGVPGDAKVGSVWLGGAGGLLFFHKALDHLASRGRKRVALLTVPGISGECLDGYRKGLQDRGLAYHPWWVQTASQAEPHWATPLILLMFRGPCEDRPDALIIADDNLVDHACAGLLQMSLRVPDDVDVVAHCNYPVPVPPIVPLTRLGYDIPKALEECIGLLGRQRRGETVTPTTVIAPLFEWEVGRADSPPPP